MQNARRVIQLKANLVPAYRMSITFWAAEMHEQAVFSGRRSEDVDARNTDQRY